MEDCEEELKDVKFMLHKSQSLTSLRLSLLTPVSKVKLLLCSQSDMRHEDCEILFCGHAMKNEENLHHYNIGPETVLHVVSRPQVDPELAVQSNTNLSCSRNSYLTGIWLHRKSMNFTYVWTLSSNCGTAKVSNLTAKHPHFYVFCNNKCQYVRKGKLRVRCRICKQDSIMLNSDPREWRDVLRPGQISGCCFSEQCGGDQCEAEFYFKCEVCSSTSPDSNGNAIALPDVVTNTTDIVCATCFDSHDPVVKFQCSDDHILCLDCFEQYARNSLRERQLLLDKDIGYTIACPEKCVGSVLTDIHLFHILGMDEYRTYQAFAAEECLFQEMKGMVCPNRGCGSGLYPDLPMPFENNTEIKCTSCGYSFCSSCRERYHGRSKCHTNFQSKSTSGVEVSNYMATIKAIKQISKMCPNCKAPIERNGGCMHMTCRMCKYEWCWNCLTRWNFECQGDHWFM